MTWDPEQWRRRWWALITAATSLITGVAVLIYEVGWGGDKEFAAMAIALIAGAPATAALGKKR